MSVKIQLMLNSKMLIDGDGDAIVATSLLEVSNLVVLKVTHAFTPFSYHFGYIFFVHYPSKLIGIRDPLWYNQMQIWEFMDKVHWT